MKKFVVISLCVVMFISFTLTVPTYHSSENDWLEYQGGNYRNGTSELTGNIITPKLLWSYSPGSLKGTSYSYPLIADIDMDNEQEIVLSSLGVNIFNGKNGSLEKYLNVGSSSVTLYDITGDGQLDIISAGTPSGVDAYNIANDSLIWHSEPSQSDAGEYGIPSIFDLNNDGNVEIIVAKEYGLKQNGTIYALNGNDGSEYWNWSVPSFSTLTSGHTNPSNPLVVSDIDLDGVPEIIVTDIMNFRMFVLDGLNGTLEWNISGGSSPPSIADVNNDGILEIITAGNGTQQYAAWNPITKEKVWESLIYGSGIYVSPAISDIDNDGILEVVVGNCDGDIYALNGEDGSILWEYDMTDTYIRSPALIVDINNDGAMEIIASSGSLIRVLHGSNGTPIFTIPCRGEVSAFAFGDIDNDNFGELVFSITTQYEGHVCAIDFGEYPVPFHYYGAIMPHDYSIIGISGPFILNNSGEASFNYSEIGTMEIAGQLSNSNLFNAGRTIWYGVEDVNVDIISDVGIIEAPHIVTDNFIGAFETNWTIGNLTENTTAYISVHAWKEGYQDAWWNVTVNIVGNFTSEASDINETPGFGFELILLASAISIAIIRIRRKKES